MSDNQSPAYGLSDTVLERAAEAHYDHYLRGFATKPDDPAIPTWRTRGPSPDAKRMFVESMRAALPVLGVAIERALLSRMIADLHDPDGLIPLADQTGDVRWFEIADFPRAEMESFLSGYLPASEQGATR